MDTKDFQLLVELHKDARQSYRSLGRRVSLSAPAVHERVSNLEREGIIQGFWLSVDPSVFRRKNLLVWFQGDLTRRDMMKALSVRDVAWVAWKVDGGLTIQMWPKDRRQAVRELAEVLGMEPTGQFFATRRRQKPLTLVDWQIIDVLLDDPKLPVNELTDSTGLSPKTVRKHLKHLIQGRALFIMPHLGALADPGELVFTLAIFGRVEMSALEKSLGDAFLVNELDEPKARYLLCRGSNLSDVTARIHNVGKLSGAESVFVTLNREQILATEFTHSLIREEIRRLKAAESSA